MASVTKSLSMCWNVDHSSGANGLLHAAFGKRLRSAGYELASADQCDLKTLFSYETTASGDAFRYATLSVRYGKTVAWLG